MSYARVAATASANRYMDQREAEQRADAYRRNSAAANKMMNCGLTCGEWMDIYLKRNLPATVVEHNTEETINDDANGGEVAGTEARSGGAGEGVGDAPGEQGQEAASGEEGGNEANWIDEAWPEGSEGNTDFTEADRTPF